MNQNESKNNKSLFLYTSLIFLVALLMIVISFFGQSHLEGARATEQKAKSITEKASVLSDENLHLTEQVTSLTETVETKDALILEQQTTLDEKISENTNLNNIIAAFKKARENKDAEAKTLLDSVLPENLSEDAKFLYDYVQSQIK